MQNNCHTKIDAKSVQSKKKIFFFLAIKEFTFHVQIKYLQVTIEQNLWFSFFFYSFWYEWQARTTLIVCTLINYVCLVSHFNPLSLSLKTEKRTQRQVKIYCFSLLFCMICPNSSTPPLSSGFSQALFCPMRKQSKWRI